MTASQDNALEKTEVLYGLDNIINKTIEFLSKAGKIDSCGDARVQKQFLTLQNLKKYYLRLKVEALKQGISQKLTKTISINVNS